MPILIWIIIGDEKVFSAFDIDFAPAFMAHMPKVEIENYIQKYNNESVAIHKSIDSYIGVDGIIDADKVQEDWFEEIQADVFISHSHDDYDNAIRFAALLDRYGISCFVDSLVWGYCNTLLEQIDDRYCLIKTSGSHSKHYRYKDCVFSSAHVHTMLNSSLMKMMDKCECIMFLDTPQSISTVDTIQKKTASPWIYSELLYTSLIKRKKLEEYRLVHGDHYSLESSLKVQYTVTTEGMVSLSREELAMWLYRMDYLKNQNRLIDGLDELYRQCGILPQNING